MPPLLPNLIQFGGKNTITENIATGIGSFDHPNSEVVSASVTETGDRQIQGWHGFIKIKTKIIKTQEVAVQTELAAPTPGGAKPISAALLPKINKSLKQLEKDQKKVDTYQGVITAINVITPIFRNMLNKTQTKVNQLQFIINTGETTQGMDVTVAGVNSAAPINSEYTNSYGKNYTLELVTTPSGFLQYQALDSFSKLKITQTAPSKSKTPDELFEEIKQILG